MIDLTGLSGIFFDASLAVAAGNGANLGITIDGYSSPWSRSSPGTWLDQQVDVSSLVGIHEVAFTFGWGSPFYTGPATGFFDHIRTVPSSPPAPVAEPPADTLLVIGLAALGAMLHRREFESDTEKDRIPYRRRMQKSDESAC
jgi:hypothetical protein